MMTDLESFRATVEHRRPGKILYHASFVDDLRKRVIEHIGTDQIEKHYGMDHGWGICLPWPKDQKPLDFSRYWENEKLPEGTTINGDGVAMVPSGFYHFWGYISPLRNAKDISEIENFPMIDYHGADDSDLKRQVGEAHKAGKVMKAWVGHMYETAWQIRGYEEFLMDMIEQPAWAQCLLDRIYEQNMIKAKAYAKAGVDWIATGDDVANQKAMMFAPAQWRQMMLSRWKNVWRTIKDTNPQSQIWYHSDGNIMDIIPDLLDAGVDILNPVQPECMDIGEVHRRFGQRATLDGCIGTQSTMPWGKPEDVRKCVKELIENYGRKGGLILSPTHVLEPEVPIANIDAFFQACREFGTFE
jgi:uroporphyrinogen decarboxylase